MSNSQQSKTIKFREIKDELIAAIKKKIPLLKLEEGVTLVDGFVNQPISMEISGSIIIGGTTVPMVMIVGNDTGRIYFFALKALMPTLWE